jgi:hypothetical protein
MTTVGLMHQNFKLRHNASPLLLRSGISAVTIMLHSPAWSKWQVRVAVPPAIRPIFFRDETEAPCPSKS